MMKLLSFAGLGFPLVAVAGCNGKPAAPPPQGPPAVVVTQVVQRDVPVYQEWIGTTAGNVNAEIRPKVDGYLLRRGYSPGGFVRPGGLLFEIDAPPGGGGAPQAAGGLPPAPAPPPQAPQDDL